VNIKCEHHVLQEVLKGNRSSSILCRQIARRFAKLTTLDQQPIDPSIAFAASNSGGVGGLTPGLSPSVKSQKSKAKAKREPLVFPVPTAPGFFESEPTRDFVGAFLTK
jgi:nuclear RNA export factor